MRDMIRSAFCEDSWATKNGIKGSNYRTREAITITLASYDGCLDLESNNGKLGNSRLFILKLEPVVFAAMVCYVLYVIPMENVGVREEEAILNLEYLKNGVAIT